MILNRARRQSGFLTFIPCQHQDPNVLPKRRQSHQGDKLRDVSTVPLVARWPVFLAHRSDADSEPHCNTLTQEISWFYSPFTTGVNTNVIGRSLDAFNLGSPPPPSPSDAWKECVCSQSHYDESNITVGNDLIRGSARSDIHHIICGHTLVAFHAQGLSAPSMWPCCWPFYNGQCRYQQKFMNRFCHFVACIKTVISEQAHIKYCEMGLLCSGWWPTQICCITSVL